MSIATQNRNAAYHNLVGKLSTRRKLWFDLIKENEPCTRQFLIYNYKKQHGLGDNESGRITELINRFLIKEVGHKIPKGKTNHHTIYETVKNQDERINLINAKFVELRDKKNLLTNDYNKGISLFTRSLLDKELNRINENIELLEKVA